MSHLQKIIASFNAQKVAVFGDVMLDRYIFGEVCRISPEAPIPVFRVKQETRMLGGAGNVARNIASLGGRAVIVGLLGSDSVSEEIAMEASTLGASFFVRDSGRRPVIKTRFVAQGQHALRVDDEEVKNATGSVAVALCEKIRTALTESSILVCSDYAKGTLTSETIAGAVSAARERNLRIVIDPKTRDLRRYAGASIITPNAHEAELATGIDCTDDEDVARAAKSIMASVECEGVVITRGPKGMCVLSRENGEHVVTLLSTDSREVNDVSGAGDTVVATIALACSAGAPLIDAARLANHAAGIVVGKVGTATVNAFDLARVVHYSALLAESQKIVDLEEAAATALEWRRNGMKVVFTNGCFDLLHPGHIRLLQKARAAGHRLIVAINSDESVKRLKGPTRPLQNEAARSIVMSSIGVVDRVLIFNEDTPLTAIMRIEPDVIVKGGDYSEDEVVGGDFVRARGGKVLLVDHEEGHSTTALVNHSNLVVNAEE